MHEPAIDAVTIPCYLHVRLLLLFMCTFIAVIDVYECVSLSVSVCICPVCVRALSVRTCFIVYYVDKYT